MVDVAPYTFGISQIAPAYAIFVSLTCTLASQVLVKLSSEELYEFANHHHLTVLFHCMMLLWSVTFGAYPHLGTNIGILLVCRYGGLVQDKHILQATQTPDARIRRLYLYTVKRAIFT
ncbi:hypothetical protein H4S01_002059 [Coemansia sp. RSA 2610]|nr:hypothetical protein H4S01_002059 [Coemansia sp. RSA 2610]